MNKTQKKKLEQIYNKLSKEIQTTPLNELDKHIDRLVYIENKLKETA